MLNNRIWCIYLNSSIVIILSIETTWECEEVETEWTFPHTESERIKYLVFRDLWQQRFVMTCGAKFGGDFLVYPGKN